MLEYNEISLSNVVAVDISDDCNSTVTVELDNGLELSMFRNYSEFKININRDIENNNEKLVETLTNENNKLKKTINSIKKLLKDEVCYDCESVIRLNKNISKLLEGL